MSIKTKVIEKEKVKKLLEIVEKLLKKMIK